MKKLSSLDPQKDKESSPSNKPSEKDEPTYVTAKELAELRAAQDERDRQNAEILTLLRESNQQLTRQIEGMQATYRPPTKEAELPEPTDEELEAALVEGTGSSKRLKQLLAAREAKLRKEFDSKVDRLQNVGLTAIAELARERLSSRKYYKRFEKEITDRLNELPPDSRVNSQVLDVVYKATVGEHFDELEKELREQIARGERGEEGTAESTQNRGQDTEDELPSPEELSGNAQINRYLNQAGMRDGDDLARRIGYKDWEDYMRKTRGRKEEELH